MMDAIVAFFAGAKLLVDSLTAFVTSLGPLLVAVGPVLVAAGALWRVRSNEKKEIKKEEVRAVEKEVVHKEIAKVEAKAERAVEEVVATREQTRKMHEFITTDVFNTGVLAEMARTNFASLEPVSRPTPLGDYDGPDQDDKRQNRS